MENEDFATLLLKAAMEDSSEAQFVIGHAYSIGQGVPKDDKDAVKWFRKAALQGHVDAQFNLGFAYARGKGVPKDEKEAAKWYRKAAMQGDAVTQFNLGWFYYHGAGVLKDFATAYAWWNLAAFHDHESGSTHRDSLAKEMTPEQIAKAQELSKELLKKIEANKAKNKK